MYPVTKVFLYCVFLYILGYDKNIYSYRLNLNIHVLQMKVLSRGLRFLKRLTNSHTLKHKKAHTVLSCWMYVCTIGVNHRACPLSRWKDLNVWERNETKYGEDIHVSVGDG